MPRTKLRRGIAACSFASRRGGKDSAFVMGKGYVCGSLGSTLFGASPRENEIVDYLVE
jgi:hypothetical protein